MNQELNELIDELAELEQKGAPYTQEENERMQFLLEKIYPESYSWLR